MNRIRKWITICLVLVLTAGAAPPGKASAMTTKEEEELAREFLRVALKQLDLIRDPEIVDYVNAVGRRIVSVLPPQPFAYRFYIVRQEVYNAFAGPGGHIFINSGLFEAMENESELAGILAHEISHVVCRHISQRFDRSSKIGIATMAAIAAGFLLGIAGAGAAAVNALTLGSVAAGQSLSLSYSRADEMQADQVGLGYLVLAGYAPEGMITMLRKIRSRQWFGSDQIPSYLMTHPASEDRMSYIDNWIEHADKNTVKPAPRDASDFRMAHARLVALYGDEGAALRRFEAETAANPEDPVSRYGYGLILARTGHRQEAALQFRKVLEKRALDPIFLKELGKIHFLDGRYEEAENTLTSVLQLLPENPDALFFLGRTRMELGFPETALLPLRKLVDKFPDYPLANYLLGEAYGRQGKIGEGHYYLGLHFRSRGDLRNAAFHLKKAESTASPEKREKIVELLKEIAKDIADARKAE